MKKKTTPVGFNTLLVHAGEEPDALTGAVAPTLVRSKTFAQKTFGVEDTYQYSRGKNPTRDVLQEKLSVLEGGGLTSVFGSGVAAEAALLLTLSPGDRILCCQEIYGGTFRLLTTVLAKFGISADFARFDTEESICNVLTNQTRYLWVETPTNPSLHIINLALVQRVSEKSGVPFVVDSTFAPPCTTRAFDYGAETVVHSLSKYIAGHNDVLGGAVITRNEKLHEEMLFMQKTLGAVLSPDECYRVLQGVKTLSLRWQRVSESAQSLAEFLAKHPKVKRVLYPGLATHPNHDIAKKQMQEGFGGVLSFELVETHLNWLEQFVNTVREYGPIIYGESLASPETILAYPPLMSHKSLPEKEREELGIGKGFFRLSLGFEDPRDIIHGLSKGLEQL